MSTILTQKQITYATIILDKAIKGLASQGFMPSTLPNNTSCAYRGTGNKKCAVGHVIPDDHELIIRELDNRKPSGIKAYLNSLKRHNESDPIFSPLPIIFWAKLQGAHDNVMMSDSDIPRTMKQNLQRFYAEFNIPMSPEIQDLLSTS